MRMKNGGDVPMDYAFTKIGFAMELYMHCDDNSDESTATCGEDHVVTESLNFFENYFKELLPIKLSKNNSSS